ncbi:hypothetical protein ACSAEA_005029, partial [Enterobacter roggenkampii]
PEPPTIADPLVSVKVPADMIISYLSVKEVKEVKGIETQPLPLYMFANVDWYCLTHTYWKLEPVHLTRNP